MKTSYALFNGLWRENPTFRLVLGMCPTLAVTNAAANGLSMGLATAFVLSRLKHDGGCLKEGYT